MTFEGDILQAKAVTLTRLEIAAPPLRLPVKGKIQFGEKFIIDAALATVAAESSAVTPDGILVVVVRPCERPIVALCCETTMRAHVKRHTCDDR